jgi:hypothetical protein
MFWSLRFKGLKFNFKLANQNGHDGATITEKIGLMQLGFAWGPGIRNNADFQKLITEIKHKI